jgi:hypothetical protein
MQSEDNNVSKLENEDVLVLNPIAGAPQGGQPDYSYTLNSPRYSERSCICGIRFGFVLLKASPGNNSPGEG